jgi:hypothetical protein
MIEPVILVLALASAQPAQAVPPAAGEGAPPQTVQRAVPTGRIVIPDDIGAAVVPYMGCLLARDGVEVRGGFDPRPAGVARGADCAPYREAAARRADALLRRIGGRSADQRRDYIERTLSAVEAFHNSTHRPAPAPTPEGAKPCD